MRRLLDGDFYKLAHSRGFKVLIALSFLFGVIGMLDGEGTSPNGYTTFFNLFADLRTLMFVFSGIFSGVYFGEDYACRTFQGQIIAGNERKYIILSKTLVFLLGLMCCIVVQVVMITAGTTLINGFGVPLDVKSIGNMLRATSLFMLQIAACSLLCVLSSVIIKNKASILAVNFLLLVLIDAIFQLLSSVSDIALGVYTKTPFFLALSASMEVVQQATVNVAIIVGFVTMMALFAISSRIFQRCELN